MVDGTNMARTVMGWMKQNAGQQETQVPWQTPPGVEFILVVEVNGLDFKKGAVAEAEVFKAGGGVRTYGGLVSVDARIEHRSGVIVATSNVKKDVPGITAYLKTSGVIEKMLVHAHLEAGEHEAFLNALSALVYIAVYDTFAQFYGERTCDKDAKGIFEGETQPQGMPPYKRFPRPTTTEASYKGPVIIPARKECPIPLNQSVVEVIPYDGHNNDIFDPDKNESQRLALERIGAWIVKKGCVIKVIEGARCPKPPKQGVALARATKPAEWIASKGIVTKPAAVEMSEAKLKELWATCQKSAGCDEDAYPWFYGAYVTIVHP